MLEIAVKKHLPDFTVEMAFVVPNDILVLFGPSGCGKTTLLRCIAGLEKPEEGRIVCNKNVLFCAREKIFLPPNRRNIGYMFQDYALFPHMNVEKNIWYGVKKPDRNAGERYAMLLEMLAIAHLPKRQPGKLSGGEKQRVALARALMAQPDILLLDEPLSALGEQTRLELQQELKTIQRSLGIPFVMVTHNWAEAQFMGDAIIFMENGQESARPNTLQPLCSLAGTAAENSHG